MSQVRRIEAGETVVSFLCHRSRGCFWFQLRKRNLSCWRLSGTNLWEKLN